MQIPIRVLAKWLKVPGAKEIAIDALRKLVREAAEVKFGAAAANAAARAGKKRVLRERVRTALYFLWKSITRVGFITDGVRDAYDDAVLEIVLPKVTLDTPMAEVVALTIQAQIDIIL